MLLFAPLVEHSHFSFQLGLLGYFLKTSKPIFFRARTITCSNKFHRHILTHHYQLFVDKRDTFLQIELTFVFEKDIHRKSIHTFSLNCDRQGDRSSERVQQCYYACLLLFVRYKVYCITHNKNSKSNLATRLL